MFILIKNALKPFQMSVILLISLCCIYCPEDYKPEPEIEGEILLSLETTRCQSVYLNVSVPDSGLMKTYSLYRDNQYIQTDTLYGTDTLIIDTGLEPSTDYLYRALYVYRGDVIDSSDIVNARTMDTTSSNFVWHVDTIADYPSVLRDVAIISDNDIWAVGELKMAGGPYNAVHWDGNEWTYFKIPTITYPNQSLIGSADLKTVYAISSSEVYFCAGASFTKWNGEEFIPLDMFMDYVGDPDYGPLWRMWSETGDDIYLVGQKGYSVHYDGTNWEKLKTGTDLFLRDIAGSGDYMFSTGYNDYGENSGKSIALVFKDGIWNTLFESFSYLGDVSNGDYGFINAVDVFGDIAYFAVKTGILKYAYKTGDFRYISSANANLLNHDFKSIIVQNTNDIVLTGLIGTIVHFNGISWNKDDSVPSADRYYYRGDFKDNTIALIGSFHWDGALIARGVR